jgi:hypothetical protein
MLTQNNSVIVNLGRMTPLVLLAIAFAAFPALAGNDLYQGKTIVTGQREESRIPGFSICLEDVLVKVSGDPRLIGDPSAGAVVARAPEFVRAYHYRDRLEGLPIHDEQGSRDRPYDLTVDFIPEKVNEALRSIGREPWRVSRPTLLMVLGVRNDNVNYLLANDGQRGIDQRESLAAAAWQMGMPLRLPDEAGLKTWGLTFETLPAVKPTDLKGLAKVSGAAVPLVGELVWKKGTLGWEADWQLTWDGKPYQWTIKDVNFDDAFRSAMRGTAQVISGHGRPK